MAVNNIGKVFKEAMSKYITKGHPLEKIVNQHTTKLSYSCMPSMATKIGGHNNKIIKNNEQEEGRQCDCPKTKGGSKFDCKWGKTYLKAGLI